jgi:2-amino-4-hydroxy-6-hydroxymethyldihydropteridine diphosphokinase
MEASNFKPVCILLGSNLGDRLHYLHEAENKIAIEAGSIKAKSSFYETAAWGNQLQPSFLNRVIIIDTLLDPENLLQQLLDIESSLGRKREKKWEPRTIDLDILFYDQLIVENHFITIPHPRIADRKFTLMPLNELIPEFEHPVLKKKIRMLLHECKDDLSVKKIIFPGHIVKT